MRSCSATIVNLSQIPSTALSYPRLTSTTIDCPQLPSNAGECLSLPAGFDMQQHLAQGLCSKVARIVLTSDTEPPQQSTTAPAS